MSFSSTLAGFDLTETAPDLETSLYFDLPNVPPDTVNWTEVADNLLSDEES